MEGMSLIVKTATRWIKGFLLLFGLYIVLCGHRTPGGGFSGGVIIACVFILLTLAEGQKYTLKLLSRPIASLLASLGALVVLGMGCYGMMRSGVFFKNFAATTDTSFFKLLSSGTNTIGKIGVSLLVGAAIYLVFSSMASIHVAVKDGKRQLVKRGRK